MVVEKMKISFLTNPKSLKEEEISCSVRARCGRPFQYSRLPMEDSSQVPIISTRLPRSPSESESPNSLHHRNSLRESKEGNSIRNSSASSSIAKEAFTNKRRGRSIAEKGKTLKNEMILSLPNSPLECEISLEGNHFKGTTAVYPRVTNAAEHSRRQRLKKSAVVTVDLAKGSNQQKPEARRFQCRCGQFFSKREHMKRHDDLVHKRLRPFSCDSCNISFGTKQNLQVHFLTQKHKIREEESNMTGATTSSSASYTNGKNPWTITRMDCGPFSPSFSSTASFLSDLLKAAVLPQHFESTFLHLKRTMPNHFKVESLRLR